MPSLIKQDQSVSIFGTMSKKGQLLITRFHRSTASLAILLLFIAASAFGQAQNPAPTPQKPQKPVDSYSLGDQMLSLNLGLFVPLFFSGTSTGVEKTNLSLGAGGSLNWASFLNNNWALGVDIGGAFAFSPNARTLFLVSITPRITYFFRSYPFDFPVFLETGVNFSRLQNDFKIDPIVRPGAGVLWNFNSNWAFGLNTTYWWIPQIYTGASSVPTTETRFGNFLDVNLTALYHF